VASTYACSGITFYSAIRKAMPIPPQEAIVLVGAGGLGLNAIKVLLALKHQNIISVDISPEKRETALKAGASAFFIKPFDDEEFLTAVRLALSAI
jgi:alcohol dehydrogenase/propanol-preferring alcohol dehydrogenase